MILAAILFVLEMMSPGIFFMWFGVAAAATGLIAFGSTSAGNGSSCGSACCRSPSCCWRWKYLRKYPLESERPLLNERAVQHIGEQLRLDRSDRERARQRKDRRSIWRVEGPELPKGARVRVIGADGTLLKVVPAAAAAAA